MNKADETSLQEQGAELTLRLAMMADRLQRTAQELQELADSLRKGDDTPEQKEG